ncbi:MAG: hypothetical protein RL754_1086 [Bacteroidota bacterium]
MLDTAEFDGFGKFLLDSFPLTFGTLSVDTFSSHTYVLNWPGSDMEAKNYLFIAHQDVVPVDRKSLAEWESEPFSGDVVRKDDAIWVYGRGALDDKSALIATLESIELLLSQGYNPGANLFFCFGQDEEIGGKTGAAIVAEHFRTTNTTFEAILDEGGIISTGSIPGLKDRQVALIGTAEKGYLSIEAQFLIPGGHSSMPNEHTALSRAAEFTLAVQNGLFEPEFSEPIDGFITHLAPEMPWGLRAVFANRWAFEPLLLHLYQDSHTGRALTNNTSVATIMASGIKDNVVPASARVVCNTRILPGTSAEEIVRRYEELATPLGGTVTIYQNMSTPASLTSSTESSSFTLLGQAVRTNFPDALISPYLTIGGTDSKNFDGLAKNTYRFLPLVLSPEEVNGIHGTNERISAKNYESMIHFYSDVIQMWGQ